MMPAAEAPMSRDEPGGREKGKGRSSVHTTLRSLQQLSTGDKSILTRKDIVISKTVKILGRNSNYKH